MSKHTTDVTRDLMRELGKMARTFRSSTGWSMCQVAGKIGVSISAVAEFEKGRSSSSNVLLGYVGLGFPVSDLEEVCKGVYACKVFRPQHGSQRGDHLPGGFLPDKDATDPAAGSGEAAEDHDMEGAGD